MPGIGMFFTYTLMNDPDRDTPLTFRGARFDLPQDPQQVVAENQKTRYRITLERLKGHLCTILGDDNIADYGQAIETIQNMLGGDAAVSAKVFCQYKKAKVGDRVYRTDQHWIWGWLLCGPCAFMRVAG